MHDLTESRLIEEYIPIMDSLNAGFPGFHRFYFECLLPALGRYQEPWRKYHNQDHILDGIRKFKPLRKCVSNWNKLLIAWLYHDIVYVPGAPGSANERCSAQVARMDLSGLGVPEAFMWEVCQYIYATYPFRTAMPDTEELREDDGAILLDVDFSGLADQRDAFIASGEKIWLEAAAILPLSHEEYVMNRGKFAEALLKRKRIFLTPFYTHLESSARDNLEWSVALWKFESSQS